MLKVSEQTLLTDTLIILAILLVFAPIHPGATKLGQGSSCRFQSQSARRAKEIMSSSFVSKHVQCYFSGHPLLKGLQSYVKDVSEAILVCSSEKMDGRIPLLIFY